MLVLWETFQQRSALNFGTVGLVRTHQRIPGVFDRQIRHQCLGKARCGVNALPNTPVTFGTNSISVPDSSVSSVQPPYRQAIIPQGYTGGNYPTEWAAASSVPCGTSPHGYELDAGTQHFGKFGTTSIPVPETSVSPVRPPKIP